MPHSPIPKPDQRESSRQSVTRCVLVAVLVLVEVGGLSIAFDTKDVRGRDWWILILRFLPQLTQSLLAAVILALIFSWEGIGRLLGQRATQSSMALPLVGHLFVTAGLGLLTWLLMQEEWQLEPAGPPLVIGWLAAGGLFLVTAFLAAFGPGSRQETLRLLRVGLIIAIPTGAAAAWLGHRALRFWSVLGGPTLWSVQKLLELFGFPVVVNVTKNSAALGAFQVHIADACSGYQGMGIIGCVVLATILTQWKRLRFPQQLLLLPLAMAVSWFLNIVRLSGLLLIGAYVSPDIALGGFHSQAGWVLMTFLSLGVIWLALRTKFFSRETPELLPFRKAPVAAHLVPFLSWLLVGMLTAAVSPGSSLLDLYYPVRVIVAVAAIAFWWSIRPVRFRGFPVAGVVAGLVVLAAWVGLELAIHGPPADVVPLSFRLESAGDWGVGWLIFRTLGSCVVVAWIEECAFRGYLMRRLARGSFETISLRESPWWAWILSSVLFGLFHQDRMIAGVIAGMIFGYVARRRNLLSDAVVAHGVANLGLTILAVSTDQMGWWS